MYENEAQSKVNIYYTAVMFNIYMEAKVTRTFVFIHHKQ